MDVNLKLKHEVEMCVALAIAVSAMLYEVIDSGGTPAENVEHAARVLGLLQDRLWQANELTEGALLHLLAR